MISRAVESRVVRLEARTRASQRGRMSRDEILAKVCEVYDRLIQSHGDHPAIIAGLAAFDPTAARQLDALHRNMELQP